MRLQRNAPDPEGLAIAREMQQRLHPAEAILQGSRAAGDHRPDSDVDLMAVCLDEAAVLRADEILRCLLNRSQGEMRRSTGYICRGTGAGSASLGLCSETVQETSGQGRPGET